MRRPRRPLETSHAALDPGVYSRVQNKRRRHCMFTIGKLASLTSVSSDTLRYYEQEGLVKPAGKSPAGYRLYDKDSARRIHFIKHAQNCGFTLAEMRDLLVLRGRDKACCGDERARAVDKKLQIESKIRAMK